MADEMADAKSGRRQYGTGSVYQRSSDGRWIGTLDVGTSSTGTRRRPSVTAKTEAECNRKLRDLARKIAKEGVPAPNARTSDTVRTYAERWLESRATKVRPKTWSQDASEVRKWIIPTIGRRRMTSIDTDAIRAVELAAVELLPSSRARLRGTLDRMLRAARVDGHPIPDRVFDVPRDKVGDNDRDALPDDDALAVLRVALERPDAPRWALSLIYGARQAEALGLTWPCVDLEDGTIDVSWQLQPVRYRHGCGTVQAGRAPCGRRFGGDCPQRTLQVKQGDEVRQLDGALCLVRPKTSAGKRTLPMLPWMSAVFVRWMEVAPRSPHALVFPRADGRPALSADDDAAWRDIQDAAQVARVDPDPTPPPRGLVLDERGLRLVGRRYTMHEGRHTAATLLGNAGVTETTAAAILGQSKLLRRYVHTSTSAKLVALTAASARLGLTAE